MAKKSTTAPAPLSNNEIRRLMLQYFYNRNKNATSARGKKGSAVKISAAKKELKEAHGLTQQEVQSNLTYLISQGWVEEDKVEKSFTAPGGTVIPSSTSFYKNICRCIANSSLALSRISSDMGPSTSSAWTWRTLPV
jgi:hypothetical protein